MKEHKTVIDAFSDINILDKEKASSILFIPTMDEHKRVMKEKLYEQYDYLMFAPHMEDKLFFNDMRFRERTAQK